jgi:hypothetical protein
MVLLLSCGSLLLLLLLPLAMVALPGTRLLAALDAVLLLPLALVALVLLGAVATAWNPGSSTSSRAQRVLFVRSTWRRYTAG